MTQQRPAISADGRLDYTVVRVGTNLSNGCKVVRCPKCGKRGYLKRGSIATTVTHYARSNVKGGMIGTISEVGEYCIISSKDAGW